METPKQVSANLVNGEPYSAGVAGSSGRLARWTVSGTTGRTLMPYENTLHITWAGEAGSSATLTMPDVDTAAGQSYWIFMIENGSDSAGIVTLSFPGSPKVYVVAGSEWTPDTLTAISDCVLLYSNGVCWFMLIDVTT